MKNVSKIMGLALTLAMLSMGAGKLAPVLHLSGGACFALVLIVMLALAKFSGKGITGVHAAGITQEYWVNHVVEGLYKNNAFLERSVKDDAYVNGSDVNVPNAGADPNIEKNRTLGGPATDTNVRTDTNVKYSIDEFTSDPFLITNAEEMELSYNKRESVLRLMQRKLRQVVADNMLYNWGATGASLSNVLRTSGVPHSDLSKPPISYAANVNSTATGNRLAFTQYDVIQAQEYLDSLDVPEEGRCMLISSKMYKQLLLDLTATEYRDFSMALNPKTGVIGSLFGFDFYKRSSVLTYTNAATPVKKAIAAAAAADDNDAALFWQEDWVRRALGSVKVFETPNSAVHYGDVYSMLLRSGGALSSDTELGVGAIVQTAA